MLSFKDVTKEELEEMLKVKDFLLLDLRSQREFIISGTNLAIPITELPARLNELPDDKQTKIVVYCRRGNDSRLAADFLLANGYTQVFNLLHGIQDWS